MALGLWAYLRLKLRATYLRFFVRLRRFLSGGAALRLAPGDIHPQRVRIPSRDPGRFIVGDLYCPEATAATTATPKTRPVLVNWHGSGFVFHNFGTDAVFCARVARAAGIYGRQTALTIPVVVAVYPPTDLATDKYSRALPAGAPGAVRQLSLFFDNCYAPDPATRTDPRISPLFADPALFPETVVVVTCGRDTLQPEGAQLAARLDDGTRTLVHSVVPGAFHAFDKMCRDGTPEAAQRDTMYADIIQQLRKALGV
ncbi:Alpha/beta hydrolase fold-3 [Niveomyces insectorum RCEF 264]|uniref:Alpha/beta hydrolase fold-3 n=1 Tax=Niveomyces insectorum RCEF 264 TaxID=1081102 RepID=A0A167TGM0_9HYPO|nr:Alpha/beta hydrolase fold-3 [Niveomyces insectorum RCEF 264]